ncbi:DUF4350 domain-containing protein [Flavobacterium sp. '19STA2R22 D10 B1']|uniref:DUF4350 domain-containing protein n=1 Tax=Flavobacterium aerium TaxID=3037261 RepID=UPI00278C598D|nr:DUF4350 domain-containing protein [Flavobacterium sp. '19STA2R22 D10 B1']
MNRTLKIYIFFLVLVIIGITVIDANRPKPINWTPTYGIKDKIPFGMYVFNKELDSLFKGQNIHRLTKTAYEYFDPKYTYETNSYDAKGTFLAIAQNYEIDPESTNELLYFAEHGNDVFLSMQSFSQQLMDSLKIDYKSSFNSNDSLYSSLVNPNLGNQKYKIVEGSSTNYFSKIDTLTTSVLGYQTVGSQKFTNFIKVPYKAGNFYLHLQPNAFTNFHLLNEKNYEYAQKVLSYINQPEIYWYIKSAANNEMSSSPMRYILTQPALKWAWYIFLIGMVIFMIFNAKRRQRIIPIITPLSNTTIEFTKTIGNLYAQEGDHDTMIDKKIIYFLEKIRHDYLMDTTVLDNNFIKKLHQKTGKDILLIQRIVLLINQHKKGNFTSVESDLIEINNTIENLLS